MSVKTWNFFDKSDWGDGPWVSEPDKIQWVDGATGLDCLMHRAPGGHWCGYVGVAEGHPAFEKDYEQVDAEVHGGLTYANFCQKDKGEGRGICHVAEPGRPEKVWWLGFDCAHFGDGSPSYAAKFGTERDVYRDQNYVKAEVESLAKQLAAMTPAAVGA